VPVSEFPYSPSRDAIGSPAGRSMGTKERGGRWIWWGHL